MSNSHCSLSDFGSRTMVSDVTRDSMSNWPRSFMPVEALVISSANVFISEKVFFTVVVLVNVPQCLKWIRRFLSNLLCNIATISG